MKQIKLISLEEELKLMKEKPVPYWFHLKKGKKQFLEFGLEHSRDSDIPQFNMIKSLIELFKPQAVLFESHQSNVDEFRNLTKEEAISKYGEMGIIFDFLNKKIKTIGADLNQGDKDYKKKLESIYREKDLHITTILHGLQYRCRRFQTSPKEELNNILELWKPMYPKEEIMPEIEKYILELTGKSIEDLKIQDRIAPAPIDKKSILNDIARTMTQYRDENMIKTIQESLKEYNGVMFFVGRNHVLRHEQYLRNYLDTI